MQFSLMPRRRFFCLLCLLLTACTSFPLQPRLQNANALADTKSWQRLTIPTESFDLIAYVPDQLSASAKPVDTLYIYIEGDGLAWISSSRLSDNPTPLKPAALELALQHPQAAVAYLARPCQYVTGSEARGCNKIYWSSHRFAPEVVAATSQAIEKLKQRFKAKKLALVGYSGGGAIAALVAARRSDVVRLITVAGNLDHVFWTRQKHFTALHGSLNPADDWQALLNIPQLHFIGANDSMISAEVTQSYLDRYPIDRRPQIKVIEEFDHACCWVKRWSELLQL